MSSAKELLELLKRYEAKATPEERAELTREANESLKRMAADDEKRAREHRRWYREWLNKPFSEI